MLSISDPKNLTISAFRTSYNDNEELRISKKAVSPPKILAKAKAETK